MFHWSILLTQEVPLPDPEAYVTSRAPAPEIDNEDLIQRKGDIIKNSQAIRLVRSMFLR